MPSAYLGYRVYYEFEDLEANLATITTLTRELFVPPFSASEGFILYLMLHLPEEGLVALNIFESQAQMIEANTRVAAFIAAELSEIITGPPAIYGGHIAVLDLSGLFSEEALAEVSEETEED